MSKNFTGVTFAKQKVTPSDDAIIRRAILPDGILYGCEMSYSGSTLTMAAGQILMCGRQVKHPASQNWAVVDATSGYARLLLTIDLTKTATKETFEQVLDSIEYASSEDGFPDLDQTDINVFGSRYQVVACVVSLGTGGITGIVSQLGKSVVESSGGLNFNLVGGLTQPADPAENMIWVRTDVPITGYTFSPTVPSQPVEGMVWIAIRTSSPVSFNALKKNGIVLYPVSAYQYVSGDWEYVAAQIGQDGEWKNLLADTVFYENGAFNTEVFGDPTGTTNVGGVVMHWVNGYGATATKLFNVAGFDRIEIDVHSACWAIVDVRFLDESGTAVKSKQVNTETTGGTFSVDISGMTGFYYLEFRCIADGTNWVRISSIKFLV